MQRATFSTARSRRHGRYRILELQPLPTCRSVCFCILTYSERGGLGLLEHHHLTLHSRGFAWSPSSPKTLESRLVSLLVVFHTPVPGRGSEWWPVHAGDPADRCEDCTKVCGKSLAGCPHTCPLPCHPGPCSQCSATGTRACFCGCSQLEGACCALSQVTDTFRSFHMRQSFISAEFLGGIVATTCSRKASS